MFRTVIIEERHRKTDEFWDVMVHGNTVDALREMCVEIPLHPRRSTFGLIVDATEAGIDVNRELIISLDIREVRDAMMDELCGWCCSVK